MQITMINIFRTILKGVSFIGASLALSACATSPTVPQSQMNSSFNIHYGVVERVERTQVASNAPQGAVMGGILGGVTSNHHNRGEHALEGAVAGALLAAILQGDRTAYKYTVDFMDGGITKVITEAPGIAEGDCVTVELGSTANIRRVSAVHCENVNHQAFADPRINEKRQQDAGECHEAKQIALQATTEEATDIALKKVRVFCE